ncbi:MAG: ATP-grasp domain-containing protein [Gemmataceae bacterium]
MRLFVYEYVSCQRGELPASLRREGAAMLVALLEDAVRLNQATVCTMCAGDMHLPPGVNGHQNEGQEESVLFRQLSAEADVTLAIAPETGGLLRERRIWTERAGGEWLGCSARAIDLTTDKLQLSRWLHDAGVPTPPCWLFDNPPEGNGLVAFPIVHKPRDGAGSQATFLARNPEELSVGLRQVRDEGWEGESLLQSFVLGLSVSVAFLVGPRQIVALEPAEQCLSDDGRFHYRGWRLPLASELAERARRLALRAVQVVPGLLGYVGVDLVLGPAADGSDDRIIEINPRLTTSYAGLRERIKGNLLDQMLKVWRGELSALPGGHARPPR